MINFIKKNFLTFIIVAILGGAIFSAGFQAGLSRQPEELRAGITLSNQGDNMPIKTDFSTFWKVWNTLNEKYVSDGTSTPVADQDKIWGAISGLASSYKDPYTVFFPPVLSKEFENDIAGNFEGVGMEVGDKDGGVVVIAPLKNTPAYNAGIMAGDQIIKIDDTFTSGLNSTDAVKLIRGKKGTKVVFTLLRKGKKTPIEISVIRDTINIPTIDTKKRDDRIFVISLYNFSAMASSDFRNALREFILSNDSKLVLDLRGNPGGYLDAAIDMASWFLPVGNVVVKEDFGKSEPVKEYRSKGYDIFNSSLKMVILVDGGSASASEILAGALQEHKIATLVGTKTFGKGVVQELLKITPDTSLKVTIARWLTPNGLSISKSGLTPDVVIERTIDDFEKGKDPQMEKAVEILLKK